jgi:hypothetical protein
MCILLHIPDMLYPIRINMSIRRNLVPSNLRPQLRPAGPVDHAEQQNSDADDWEHIVRVSVRIPVAIWRDEGYKSEKQIGKQIEDGDGKIGVPWGCPLLALGVVQIDKTSCDKTVDPGAGVSVQIHDKVVGWTGRWREENHDCD